MTSDPPIVCVVEADAAVRNALKFSLEVEGWEVRVYADAPSLLDDPGLPSCRCLVVDGLELVEALGPRGVAVPVIMMAGRASPNLKLRAEKLGVRRVIEKPLPDGELLKAIETAISDGCPP